MASKKEWKARAKAQERLADDLFNQSVKRAKELACIDMLLANATLPGPTIDAWAQQVRDLLSDLVRERGLIMSPLGQQFTVEAIGKAFDDAKLFGEDALQQRVRVPMKDPQVDDVVEGEYSLDAPAGCRP